MIGESPMSRTAILFALVALLGGALALKAQSADFETVLLPVSGVQDTPGAFGSLWRTEFTALAIGDEFVLKQTEACQACPPLIHVSPGFPLQASPGGSPGNPPGALLYVSRETANNAWFELRIRDVSRELEDWGTELPVIHERNLFTTELALVDVPVRDGYRQALRVYDVDDHSDTVFHVTLVDLTGKFVADRYVAATPTPISLPGFPRGAAVAEVMDLRLQFPEVIDLDRVTIVVTPSRNNVRFWAFVSVTNNNTQHVTAVTPQH